MTQEELNELASDCRLAFGHQAGAYNDGVDAMLRAVSIAQAQAAVEPVGKVLEVAADGSFQTGFFEELPVGTLLYTSPPDPGGLLRDALSNLNDLADQKNAEIDALKEAMRLALEALQLVPALIQYQFTGDRDAMNALQNASNACEAAIAALEGMVNRV